MYCATGCDKPGPPPGYRQRPRLQRLPAFAAAGISGSGMTLAASAAPAVHRRPEKAADKPADGSILQGLRDDD
jgi:hypothetical protein